LLDIVRLVKLRRLKWAGHVAYMWKGRRLLGSCGIRCEDNIAIYLEEIVYKDVDDIQLAQDSA
jgi:hypothetical protein